MSESWSRFFPGLAGMRRKNGLTWQAPHIPDGTARDLSDAHRRTDGSFLLIRTCRYDVYMFVRCWCTCSTSSAHICLEWSVHALWYIHFCLWAMRSSRIDDTWLFAADARVRSECVTSNQILKRSLPLGRRHSPHPTLQVSVSTAEQEAYPTNLWPSGRIRVLESIGLKFGSAWACLLCDHPQLRWILIQMDKEE